jgi:hypothetical protein
MPACVGSGTPFHAKRHDTQQLAVHIFCRKPFNQNMNKFDLILKEEQVPVT